MCECLDYEDGDRYRCPVCADIDRALRAENERLREALQEIAKGDCEWYPAYREHPPNDPPCPSEIARAALAPPAPEAGGER